MIDRRRVLQTIAGATVIGASIYGLNERPASVAKLPPHFSGKSLFGDIETYDELGIHRTATPVDHATTRWLADHLRQAGFETSAQRLSINQFFPTLAAIDLPGRRVMVHPQWPITQSIDLQGQIAPGDIALVEFPYKARASIDLAEYQSALVAAKDRGARAAVAVTHGPTGGVIVMNAPKSGKGIPLPTVLVAPRDRPVLLQALQAQARIRLRIDGRIEANAPALNTIGYIDRKAPWIVVSTPQSGWTNAAGERGPGVALWRALAIELAHFGKSSILFVATTGHELGHLGAKVALPLIAKHMAGRELNLWLHLGANIATRGYEVDGNNLHLLPSANEKRFLVGTSSALAPLAWSFVGEPGLTPLPAVDVGLAGEIATVLEHGFRPAVGIFGSALFHHTFGDRATQATSPALLESVGARLLRFVRFVDGR